MTSTTYYVVYGEIDGKPQLSQTCETMEEAEHRKKLAESLFKDMKVSIIEEKED